MEKIKEEVFMAQLRARDYHLTVGELPTGLRNKLTDVPGVTVGQIGRAHV